MSGQHANPPSPLTTATRFDLAANLDSAAFTFILVAVAFLIRFLFGWIMSDSLDADPDAYKRLAWTWAQTGTYGQLNQDQTVTPTAYRPPLYPWILHWIAPCKEWKTSLIGLHAALGALTVYWTYILGKHLKLAQCPRLAAAILVLIDPILLRQSSLIMTETLATCLSVAIWYLAVRTESLTGNQRAWHWFVIGASVGIACLCRPTSVLWALVWSGFIATRSAKHAFAVLLGCLLILFPWWERNRQMLGQGVWMTTHGGYTLLLANNPILYKHLEQSGSREWNENDFHLWWDEQQKSVPIDPSIHPEVQTDRFASRLAKDTITHNWTDFLRGVVVRQAWFWAWWPSERQASLTVRWLISIWYGGISLVACIALYRMARAYRNKMDCGWIYQWGPAFSLLISLCATHSVYWSNMRMRSVLIPMISLLVAYSLNAYLKRNLCAEEPIDCSTKSA